MVVGFMRQYAPWVYRAGVATTLCAFYVWFVTASTGSANWLVIDFLEMIKVFGVDDAYRFYSAKEAFERGALYSWNYILPLSLLLDGVVVFLAQDSLYVARLLKLLPLLASLCFVYMTLRRLMVREWVALASVILLGLMPVYFMVFMSFYGEGWAALLLSVATWAVLSQRFVAASALVGLSVLARPECFFIVVAFGVFFLYQKRWRALLVLLLPGALYFGWLLLALDALGHYFEWREVFGQLMSRFGDVRGFYDVRFLSTFNLFWLLPAILALFLRHLRRYWMLPLSVILLILFFVATAAAGKSFYEARYFVSILPLLAIGFACAVDRMLASTWLSIGGRGGVQVMVLLLLGFILLEHSQQMDAVRMKFGAGERWPIQGGGAMLSRPLYLNDEQMSAPKAMAGAIYKALENYPQIDHVLIYDAPVLYYLDPARIPEKVTVGLAPFVPGFLGDNLFSLFPEGRQYGFFEIAPVTSMLTPRVAYIGRLNCESCQSSYSADVYRLYIFEYRQHDGEGWWRPRSLGK